MSDDVDLAMLCSENLSRAETRRDVGEISPRTLHAEAGDLLATVHIMGHADGRWEGCIVIGSATTGCGP